MRDHSAIEPLSPLDARLCRAESLERRPIGTNGYVSTWGAMMSVCPPQTSG